MTGMTLRVGRAAMLALISILVLSPTAGRAQVPQTISYQGSLTDAGGAPVTGAFTLTFTLYDAAVAGTTLWQETQAAVPVSNSAFSVVFGADAGNPLDPSVFENQTYLGIQVVAGPGVPGGGDPEMTPRQALTAVGYAFRAKTVETDTLNALSCAAGEVAKWDGAAWSCLPDNVDGGIALDLFCTSCVAESELGFDPATQAELSAVAATHTSDLAAHAGDAAAHHARYTDAEALAAVGPHTLNTDTLAGLGCATDQVARWNGSAWVCGDPGLRALRLVTVNDTVLAGQRAGILAECNVGETIVSGGWSGQNILNEGSWPAFFFSPQAWVVNFFNDKLGDISVTVQAICGTL